jgi:hypothetical protein
MNVSPQWTPIETEEVELVDEDDDDQRRANARGTIDRYCHILTGERGHYTGTLCGLTLEPPQNYGHEPPPEPCPNGHPSCPECAQLDRWST